MRYAHKTDSQSVFGHFPRKHKITVSFSQPVYSLFCKACYPPSGRRCQYSQTNQLSERTVIRGSGYPVPRFVTLKKDLAYLRVGPGREYQLDWVYVRQNLPLKVISEFDVWRKVVDHEGTTGWLHSSLLSLKRFGLVTKAEINLYDRPRR